MGSEVQRFRVSRFTSNLNIRMHSRRRRIKVNAREATLNREPMNLVTPITNKPVR